MKGKRLPLLLSDSIATIEYFILGFDCTLIVRIDFLEKPAVVKERSGKSIKRNFTACQIRHVAKLSKRYTYRLLWTYEMVNSSQWAVISCSCPLFPYM